MALFSYLKRPQEPWAQWAVISCLVVDGHPVTELEDLSIL